MEGEEEAKEEDRSDMELGGRKESQTTKRLNRNMQDCGLGNERNH